MNQIRDKLKAEMDEVQVQISLQINFKKIWNQVSFQIRNQIWNQIKFYSYEDKIISRIR